MSSPGSPGGPSALRQPPSSSVEHRGHHESDPVPGLLFPATSSLLARRLRHLRAYGGPLRPVTRRQREMVPTDKKDEQYRAKRQKNNEAARRSREKRRLKDLVMEDQLLALGEENAGLRAQLIGLQCHISLRAETSPAVAAPASFANPAPPFFQTGLWGHSWGPPVSVLGVGQQEPTSLPFEPSLGRFASATGAAVPGLCEAAYRGFFPLGSPTSPPLLPRGAGTKRGRSEEAEAGHQQVSSSDEIHSSTGAPSRRASSARPDLLHRAFAFSPVSHTPQRWLVPHGNPSNDLLAPWRSSFLAPAPVYPPPGWVAGQAACVTASVN
ncbi:uncharacterized protein LOC143002961 [Genypterus blacodes]|uniref:uncharacterized protein LOC143002961 n=1 Tax=Genypterus blacodes TaxID=154954 RepID=UPI003F76553D